MSQQNLIHTQSMTDLPTTESDIVQCDELTASESFDSPHVRNSSRPNLSAQESKLPNTPINPYEYSNDRAGGARGGQPHSSRDNDDSIQEEKGFDNRSANQYTRGYDNRSSNQHARNHDNQHGSGGHADTVTGSSDSQLTPAASDEESARSNKPKHQSHHSSSRHQSAKSSKTLSADDSRLIHKHKYSSHSQRGKQEYYVNVSDMPHRGSEDGRSRTGRKYWLQICCGCTVTWLCGILFGLIALILAMMARYRSEEGDDVEANHIAWTSFMVSMAALIVGLAIMVTVLALYYSSAYYLAQCYCRDIYSTFGYRNCSTCY